MKRRREKWLFWAVIAAVLVLGARRILADPNHPAAAGDSPVIITEFMAANGSSLLDEDGDASDWIELYNRSSEAVDLNGWSLTDDPAQPDKWVFRPLTLQSGERLIVFASDKNRRSVDPEEGHPSPHTNFRLDSNPGFVGLYGPSTRIYLDASTYTYPRQYTDIAYGVVAGRPYADPAGQRYFSMPTPGAANDDSQAWIGLLDGVEISAAHGLYTEPFTVTLTTADPAAQIRYTTDGSAPDEAGGTLYVGPLTVAGTTVLRAAAFKPGYHPSPISTQSYIFVDDVLRQPADPPGFPRTWGTHSINFGGYAEGTPVEADYAMDARIVDDPDYGPRLRQGLADLPSLSLVTDIANLDIYATPQLHGAEVERPISVELFDPSGREPGFQIDAGLRIQGGAGRWEYMPKHSFRLFFKQQYGASKLDYPLFAGSPVTAFDTLVLRAGVDRAYAGHPDTPETPVDHHNAVYIEDEWLRDSQIATSGVGAHGRFVHLYINGLYWGLYNLVERPDASFASSYLGGAKDDWFAANHGGAVGGLPDRFDVMLQLAQAGGLDDPQKYATMLEFVDPVQFSDYVIVNWYAGNRDWPENNWYVDVLNPAGRNQFFVWDGETTWNDGAEIVLGTDGWEGAPYPNVVKLVLLALMENPEFRTVFADRLYRHLHGDGALADANAAARWSTLAGQIETAIVGESARWGDVRHAEPITVDDWQTARDRVLAQMEGNAVKLLALARTAGYYPAIDPPSFSTPGGAFAGSQTISMTAANGTIFYTLDSSDPRAVGGAVSPGAREYAGPVTLTGTARLQARVREGGVWSALQQADFVREDQRPQVRITEIMYHPVDDENAEFVEVTNLGEAEADLSGAYFEGIEYRFGRPAVLAPGAAIVLVRDFGDFRDRYSEAEVYGVYGGKLADGGETLRLLAADGSAIDAVTYDDRNGWPLSADGAGDALALADAAGDPNRPESWRASVDEGGDPGEYAP